MIKKILLAIVSVLVVARLIPFSVLFATECNLPWVVIANAGIICLYGLYVVAKGIFKDVSLKEILFYFGTEAILVLFNLLYCKFFFHSSLDIWEVLVLGNVLTVIFNPIVVLYFSRKKKYIKINW